MQSSAATVEEYLNSLPDDRGEQLRALLDDLRPHLPEGLSEQMGFGMITWVVPLEREPVTYNGKPLVFVALASQKQYISLYLMTLYAGCGMAEDEFRQRWSGPRVLNMGRSCVRVKHVDHLDLSLVAEALERASLDEFIALSRAAHGRVAT